VFIFVEINLITFSVFQTLTLLKVYCASHTSDVREPHATRELPCGHPCYMASSEMVTSELRIGNNL
jgi:hypothetical protein